MKKNFKKVNAGIIVIGNEILSGRTQDLNVSFIAKWLNEKNGRDYFFISKTKFKSLIQKRKFLEHAKVFKNY